MSEAERKEVKKANERRKKVTNKEIIELNTKALLEGMTYGQYVAKYNIK